MEKVIRLQSVDVKYRLRHSLFRHSYYEALKDVSFDVHKGETLGIVGRNGCGKTTLLKLLAGIFQPDGGSVARGATKVSLLSLDAGFDPKLPGFENAVICAMMLGHRKSEVIKKLDDIIEYSELGEFIHEPVKTYSSGMRARLGFSVAIQMQADVILIDEVLSVGDANFQKKAEATMLARIDSDQTVVIVSHSEKQIRELCQRAVWLEDGRVRLADSCETVADAYQEYLDKNYSAV
jgi:lipopolysaccharide transport system ATP-binding protein